MSGGPADLLTYGTATLGEAWPQARVIDAPLCPLAPGMALAGRAVTVRCKPGDNLALHLAMAQAGAGDVLVVDYGGSCGSGPFGEIMALACQLRGIAGLVTDGAVRDSAQIAALGFPVFARGAEHPGDGEAGPGRGWCAAGNRRGDRADGRYCAGGCRCGCGAWRADDLTAALAACDLRAQREAVMMDRLRAGETTLQILGLDRGEAR